MGQQYSNVPIFWTTDFSDLFSAPFRLQAQGRLTDLTHRVKAQEASEASLKQQLAAAHTQTARLQQELADKGRATVLSEARRDALQAEVDQVRSVHQSGGH